MSVAIFVYGQPGSTAEIKYFDTLAAQFGPETIVQWIVGAINFESVIDQCSSYLRDRKMPAFILASTVRQVQPIRKYWTEWTELTDLSPEYTVHEFPAAIFVPASYASILGQQETFSFAVVAEPVFIGVDIIQGWNLHEKIRDTFTFDANPVCIYAVDFPWAVFFTPNYSHVEFHSCVPNSLIELAQDMKIRTTPAPFNTIVSIGLGDGICNGIEQLTSCIEYASSQKATSVIFVPRTIAADGSPLGATHKNIMWTYYWSSSPAYGVSSQFTQATWIQSLTLFGGVNVTCHHIADTILVQADMHPLTPARIDPSTTAIVISGHARNWEDTLGSVQQILDKFPGADVHLDTYHERGFRTGKNVDMKSDRLTTREKIAMARAYGACRALWENTDNIALITEALKKQTLDPTPQLINMAQIHSKMANAFLRTLAYKPYKTIVRIRPDIVVHACNIRVDRSDQIHLLKPGLVGDLCMVLSERSTTQLAEFLLNFSACAPWYDVRIHPETQFIHSCYMRAFTGIRMSPFTYQIWANHTLVSGYLATDLDTQKIQSDVWNACKHLVTSGMRVLVITPTCRWLSTQCRTAGAAVDSVYAWKENCDYAAALGDSSHTLFTRLDDTERQTYDLVIAFDPLMQSMQHTMDKSSVLQMLQTLLQKAPTVVLFTPIRNDSSMDIAQKTILLRNATVTDITHYVWAQTWCCSSSLIQQLAAAKGMACACLSESLPILLISKHLTPDEVL